MEKNKKEKKRGDVPIPSEIIRPLWWTSDMVYHEDFIVSSRKKKKKKNEK